MEAESIEAARRVIAPVTRATETKRRPDDSNSADLAWPRPSALISQLESLRGHARVQDWADATLETINRLLSQADLGTALASESLAELNQLLHQSNEVLVSVEDRPDLRTDVLCAGYALQRRLDVWSSIAAILKDRVGNEIHDREILALAAGDVEKHFGTDSQFDGWRTYLMLDELASATTRGSDGLENIRQLVLARMGNSALSSHQKTFLAELPLHKLRTALQWCSPRTDQCHRLLLMLEQLETDCSAAAGTLTSVGTRGSRVHRKTVHALRQTIPARRGLSACACVLKRSSDTRLARLGLSLETHYRNANMRFAISESLLNRCLPEVEPQQAPVNGWIMGARVSGQSTSNTRLSVRVLPDDDRIRLLLRAQGDVLSNTAARRGPVTVYSRGESAYLAQKVFLLDRHGLQTEPSEAHANSRSRTRGLRTDYDGIPLVRSIVRNMAMDRQAEQMPRARRVMNNRVASSARSRFDSEVEQRMQAAVARIETRLLEPIHQLDLNPTAIELETTDRRAIMRCRLAADHQLAAFTPRPRALTHSLASLQVHQSAINNTIASMGLGARNVDLRELYSSIVTRLGIQNAAIPDDMPDDVTLNLADDESVRIECHNNRVTLTVGIAELSNRVRTWRAFVVRSHYEPAFDGPRVVLRRSSSIELIGRLRMRDQFALRGIFTKVFARDREIPILPRGLTNDSRLADLEVQQCTIRDGWIGISLCPGNSALR